MEDYNFWRDLFDTYQSLPPWMQFAWMCGILLAYIATATIMMLGLSWRPRRRRRRRRGPRTEPDVDRHPASEPVHPLPSHLPPGAYAMIIGEDGVQRIEHLPTRPALNETKTD